MEIVNMNRLNEEQLRRAAQMLTDELPLGWESFDAAMEEINTLFISENTLLAAIERGEVAGWCGILPSYSGNVFELHPLVVDRHRQRRGIGTRLVRAAEEAARERGGITIWIGADDELPGGETSLAEVDLYDDLPGHIQRFDPGTHQTAFYMKMGYNIVGVMPDANGIGKPDIFLAKRLSSTRTNK